MSSRKIIVLAATFVLSLINLHAPCIGQVLLDPLTQPKFVNPLPIPTRINLQTGGTYAVAMNQFNQNLGLVDPVLGTPLTTTVWGYNGTYPGPTIVARSGVPIQVQWTNNLTGGHILPVDTSIHAFYMYLLEHYGLSWDPLDGPIPVVPHLHGGHTESASDGLPEQWWLPNPAYHGATFVKTLYTYDNSQEGATLWYHDHVLGITRLNVYAGLAGFYLIRDDNEDALIAANNLPSGPYEIELVIQDRIFTADGQLFYPSIPLLPGQPDPSVLPEFFGNIILVNGKAWPVLDVEPRQYRLRFLNGSDSRFYNMWLTSGNLADTGPIFNQIGTDDGLLDAPVPLNQLLIGPGERADVVIDFSDPLFWGQTLILRNNAREPFPKGATVNPRTAGQLMAFRVVKPLDTSVYPLTTLPANLRPVHGPIVLLMPTPGVPARQLILFEGVDAYGRLQPLLGTTAGAKLWDDPITELPMLNDTEIWTIYNTTPDAHPIHLHLVAFQILDRQKFTATVNPITGVLTNISLKGQPKPPAPEEAGWKDTAQMYPGEVTRVIATFDRAGRYVWHCHILSHEDHEMMRPFYVVGP